jgi:DNA helicase HerA-like ATPase
MRRGPGAGFALGRTDLGTVVGTRFDSGQGRHLAVVGETGMGKSSLLTSLAARLPAGVGLVVLDPLGETADAVRRAHRGRGGRRPIWCDPTSGPGVNALEGIGPGAPTTPAFRERCLGDLVQSLRRVRSGRYSDASYWGPRLEEMLTRALRAAAAIPGGTLEDAHALLESSGRGYRTVPPEARSAVGELLERVRQRPDDAEGARRLLYEVVGNPVLRDALCARNPSASVRDWLSSGRTCLVSGSAMSVGESTARYLLSVYLALAWSELLARPAETKTVVMLDEAQWYAHESLVEMLRLGRRRNLHVVLATQSIASLPEGVREATWTNVADFTVFRCAPSEAREFSRLAPAIDADALSSLPRGDAVVLLGKGQSVHWVRAARGPSRGILPAGRSASVEAMDAESPRPSDALSRVLERVREGVERTGQGGPVPIPLTSLRSVDPDGRAVRSAGTLLGRSGALVRRGPGPGGASWWIDADALARFRTPTAPAPPKTGSGTPQPS